MPRFARCLWPFGLIAALTPGALSGADPPAATPPVLPLPAAVRSFGSPSVRTRMFFPVRWRRYPNMPIESQGGNGQGAAGGILSNINVEDAQQVMEQTRAAVEHAVETASDFIRERPILCLAGAVALGYVIGKIVSR